MGDRARILTAVVIAIFVVVGGFLVTVGTPEADAGLRAARSAGIKDPQIIDSGFLTFRCSDDDSSYYRIKGTNAQGAEVTATVCCGVFKDCTVRY